MIGIRADVMAVVERHVVDTTPEEAVGFLGAPDSNREKIIKVAAVINTATDPYNSYEVDEQEQLAVWEAWGDQGLRVVGTYHSHVGCAPTMSQLDVAHARDSKMLHLILSVVPGKGLAEAAMWRVEYQAGRPEVVPVEWTVSPT